MSADKIIIIALGIGLVVFIYWFFLGKDVQDENNDNEAH